MGNKFTRKFKFGSSPDKDDKGTEGDDAKKGTVEAEPNAKAPDSSVDKTGDKTGSGDGTEVKVETVGGTADTDDVKVTVAKEIPKINIQDEGEGNDEVDIQ